MVFKAKAVKNSLIDKYFEKAWQELIDFFGFSPKYKPKIFILDDRKSIDTFMDGKTAIWCKNGYIRGNIFLLNPKKYSTVTDREFDPKRFYDSVIHETCHHFFVQITSTNKPTWLNEGVSLYFGNQLMNRPKPDHFQTFLKFYQTYADEQTTVYHEAGFVIEKLINKFKKEKLFELLQSLKTIKTDEEFNQLFKQIYGFDLNYDNINKL